MKHAFGRTLVLLSVGLASLPAAAYRHGDMVVRLGATVLSPNDSSGALVKNDVDMPNTRVRMNTNTQPELGFMYMFHDSFGAEIQLSTPFQHQLTAQGNITGGTPTMNPVIGKTGLWSPEINLQWYPLACDSVFQPYVGLGGHYAMFSDQKVYGSWISATGGSANLTLKDRFGWNAQVGMDMALNDSWFINLGVRYLGMKTKGVIQQTSGTLDTYKFNLKVNPVMYTLGIAYKF